MSKKKPADPHAAREALKYDNPIPSREYILQLLEKEGRPLSREVIAEALKLRDEASLEALRRRLRAMERDGQLIFNRRREYGLVSHMNLVRGRVIGHPDGFGFLVPDEGGEDVFLSAREMRSLQHGDRALVSITGVDRRGRREGSLVEVLERANQTLVGRLFIEGGVAFVVSDNKRIHQDILIPPENLHGAKHGLIVTIAVIEQPTKYRQPIGKVVEILGEHMAPGMEIDVAIRSHGLPLVWTPETENQIVGLSTEVPEADKQGREDIRHLPLVTIDGEDARDFDDAVFCEANAKGWRLVVAIADVSHYVEPGSPLDADARERSTSVYFPERVIPMLPEILSNGLCSLNPQVDRLCMVCDMQLSKRGVLEEYRFYPGVMHSHARLTYTKVAAMLVNQDPQLRQEYESLLLHLQALYDLYTVLHRRREQRGAIDFDTTETRIVFGPERKIERIVPLVRNDAHRMIEEFMITANVATAHYLLKNKIPALYRIHEGPTAEKLEDLRAFLGEFGLYLGGGDDPQAQHYAELLNEIKERPDAHLIQTVLLRSLRQAVYSPDNVGHFGLAFDAYAHFTSPIRRYPDLLVHRAIRHVLSGQPVDTFEYDHESMLNMGEHCSQNERRADEATRDAIDWLKCEYMLDKVGEEFEGTISTVTSFGLFVELDEIYVEGLIHVTGLANDYFQFDPIKHRMLGERTRQSYRLGDRLRIRVARVDLDERKIDFDLVETGQRPATPSRRQAEEKTARRRRGKTLTKKKAAKKKSARHKSGKPKDEKKKAKKKVTGKKSGKPSTGKKKSKKKGSKKQRPKR
ncbi:MAG: ribonuclease R [Acidiferrobacterales bacterium]|nr:ribonuclease R [Acidiferrobacterales bacterium]